MEGIVIYWNEKRKFGFLQSKESKKTYYFNNKEVLILSKVTFELKEITRRGRLSQTANIITFSEAIPVTQRVKSEIDIFKPQFGKILKIKSSNWVSIQSIEKGEKLTVLHRNRFLASNFSALKENDILVYCPVISKRMNSNDFYFALYAYLKSNEEDLLFLETLPSIEEQEIIKELYDNSTSYGEIVKTISKYSLNSIEVEKILPRCLGDDMLLLLWRSNKIDNISTDILKKYFINAPNEEKGNIIEKVKNDDLKEMLMLFFVDTLEKENRLSILNNSLKSALNLLNRCFNNANEDFKANLLNKITGKLAIKDKIELWSLEYLSTSFISDKEIKEHLDLSNLELVKRILELKKDANYKDKIYKAYEEYFIQFSNDRSLFEKEKYKIISYLHVIQSEFEEDFKKIYDILRISIGDDDFLFELWVLDLDIEFDFNSYIENNLDKINHYYRIRSFIKSKHKIDKEVSEEGLIQFIESKPWNNLISPTEIEGYDSKYVSFIEDFTKYNENKQNIKLSNLEIGQLIYNSMPNEEGKKFRVEHIRLFIYGYVGSYDYIGFRNSFKQLTKWEKKIFREKISYYENENVIENTELLEVVPCNRIENGFYIATIQNIYFGNGYLRLKIAEGEYTEKFPFADVSTGLNRVALSSYLNTIELKIKIIEDKNVISEIVGIDILMSEIYKSIIQKSLGEVRKPWKLDYKENNSYTEDVTLRKKIIQYLNEQQSKELEPVRVKEPYNFMRRLDSNSGIDTYQLCQLFSLKTSDGFAIIWENIDLSEDRATFIFKTTERNHDSQIQVIKEAIASVAQFRAALISRKSSTELDIFKRQYGYVCKLRRTKGESNAFEKWLKNFNAKIIEPIPKFPTPEEIQSIKNWSPNIPSVGTGKGYNPPKPEKKPSRVDVGGNKENFSEPSNKFSKEGTIEKLNSLKTRLKSLLKK